MARVRPVASSPRGLICSSAPSQKNGIDAVAEGVACRSRRTASISAGVARRTISTSVDGTATVVSPQRSITTCVTAVVSGRISLNEVPCPARAGGLDAAAHRVHLGAHHVHADAAAGQLGHRVGGREARA